MNNKEIKKIVLAYSGGLDTSIIIPWLKENYNNPEIIAVSGDNPGSSCLQFEADHLIVGKVFAVEVYGLGLAAGVTPQNFYAENIFKRLQCAAGKSCQQCCAGADFFHELIIMPPGDRCGAGHGRENVKVSIFQRHFCRLACYIES